MANPDEVIDAFLRTLAQDGWGAATIDRIARRGNLHPSEVVRVGDRWAILDLFLRRLDTDAVERVVPEPGSPVRDRLFDLVMARFEAMQPYRRPIERLAADARRYPGLGLALFVSLGRTANLLAGAAGVNTVGLTGIGRIKALAALIADVGRTWLDDRDPDLGRTMRALDRRLAQAERCARLCPQRASEVPPPADTAAAAI